MIHTDPKSQFGRMKDGLRTVAYWVEIEAFVNMDPIPPVASQPSIETSSL